MAKLVIEKSANGSVDGVNTLFWTSASYVPGSVRAFVNGQLKRQDLDDGWIELGGKKVQLKEAPRTGEVVQFYYLVL